MKVKLLFAMLGILAIAAMGFAQPFSACLYDDATYLTRCCDDPTPLPDGTIVTIHYFSTGEQIELCNNPPSCPDGPVGSYNMDSFPMNGVSVIGEAGLFYQEICLTSVGITPVDHTYFCRVVGDTIHYGNTDSVCVLESAPFTPNIGPQEIALYDWSCHREYVEPQVPPCQPSDPTFFADGIGPHNESVCVTLCHEPGVHQICVGPIAAPDRIPHVTVFPGCSPTNTPCDVECPPAAGFLYDDGTWVLTQIGGALYYCNVILLPPDGIEGCVCVHLDFIEAAEMGEVAVVPMDNAVKLTWTTNSETNLDKFVVTRDGSALTEVKAANEATGHSYSYTDESAENGHTYTYSLEAYDLDNNHHTVFTSEAVTPSELAAVITEYALHQNFPNPFNPSTSIRFDLVDNNFVTLKVYNATGQEVATLVNGNRAKGVNFVNFDASNLTTGLYFYTIKVGNVYSATKKMLLVK